MWLNINIQNIYCIYILNVSFQFYTRIYLFFFSEQCCYQKFNCIIFWFKFVILISYNIVALKLSICMYYEMDNANTMWCLLCCTIYFPLYQNIVLVSFLIIVAIRKDNLMEEGFILALSQDKETSVQRYWILNTWEGYYRNSYTWRKWFFTPCLTGSRIVFGIDLDKMQSWEHSCNDLLPPTRPYLLPFIPFQWHQRIMNPM